MCLYSNDVATLALRLGSWPLKVYKALRWNFNGNFKSATQSFIWRPGVNKSDRPSTGPDKYDEEGRRINRGFHVYLNKGDAEQGCGVGYNEVVVELIALSDHFVAAGTDNGSARAAVFTELSLPQEEYDRALAATKSLTPDDEDEEDDEWDEDEEDDWEEEDDYEDEEEDDWDWDEDEEEDDDWEDEDEEEEDEEGW